MFQVISLISALESVNRLMVSSCFGLVGYITSSRVMSSEAVNTYDMVPVVFPQLYTSHFMMDPPTILDVFWSENLIGGVSSM